MDIRKITDEVSVAPQLLPGDMAAAAAQGFRSVICNRPDGEAADQPTFDEVEAAAQAAGLQTRYMPIVSGKVRDEDAEDFGRALMELPGPVLAYCRTGTRSIMLDALANTDRSSADVRIERARRAGYDLSAMRERLGE